MEPGSGTFERHTHPLTLTNDRSFICDGCQTKGLGKSYYCAPCDYDLHEKCVTLPLTLSAYMHPQHPLSLMVPNKNNKPCDICKGSIEGFFYRCKLCEFVVDPICTEIAQHISHIRHPAHHLEFHLAGDSTCAVCNGLCQSWRYRCELCKFDIHLKCMLAGASTSTAQDSAPSKRAIPEAAGRAWEKATEKVAAEARKKEDARVGAERATVERVVQEARARAIAQAKAKQQENNKFGASASQSGRSQDVEGEIEKGRRAELERQQRIQERVAKALAEKIERDLQGQRDQAERDRISETLDLEIKLWGAGKEGNLRALLLTLQNVLGPECGWQPVSSTDLLTAASVKQVYRKATLCIHPDKVQQKGANLKQKFIAKKVFDLIKEAWKKFKSEEHF